MASGVRIKRVISSGGGYTKVEDENGRILTIKGTVAWRSNNPGNLRPGSLTNSLGAVGVTKAGSNGKFLVFPDYETGLRAQESLQFQSPTYANRTIAEAIRKYAPSADNNNPAAYAQRLADAMGVSVDTRMGDLTPEQRAVYMQTQHSIENNSPGTIYDVDGTRLPPLNIPEPTTAIAAIGQNFGGQGGSDYASSFAPLPFSGPLIPSSASTLPRHRPAGLDAPQVPGTFGGRLPAEAQYGVDKLMSGQVARLPSIQEPFNTGSFDPQMSGMGNPQQPQFPHSVPGFASPSVADAQAESQATHTVANPAYAAWQAQYGHGGANVSGSPDDRDEMHAAIPPAPPPTIQVQSSAPPSSGQNIFGAIQQGISNTGQSLMNTGGNIINFASQTVPTVAEQAKDATIKAILMSPQARGAIIDPILARAFTDKSGTIYDNPNKYGATFADRQFEALQRAALQQGLPMPQRSMMPQVPAGNVHPILRRPPSSDQRGQAALRASGMLDQFGMIR